MLFSAIQANNTHVTGQDTAAQIYVSVPVETLKAHVASLPERMSLGLESAGVRTDANPVKVPGAAKLPCSSSRPGW